jgi:hypothetical protein
MLAKPDERQVDADGKHFEGLLAAFDQRIPDGGPKPRRINRYESRTQDDQNRQMQEAIGRQIGLIVGVKGIEQSARKQLLKLG